MSERKRIVVKVGSSLLADSDTLALKYAFMHGLMTDIAHLRSQGNDVVLMSSGAVALGCNAIGVNPAEASIQDKQAAAACGQPLLLNAYRQIAQESSLYVAQLLVTMDEMEDRERFINIKNTLEHLFDHPVVPIVNENDSVATAELRVGDNDRLAAKVAQMIQADHFVMLTSVDGLYDRNPAEEGAQFIPSIEDVNQYLEATEGTSALGSGGMKTKLQAANMAQQLGCTTYIAEGVLERPISSVLENRRRHTRCLAHGTASSAWSSWLTNRLQVGGSLVLSAEKVEEWKRGLSPACLDDLVAFHGEFSQGDVVHLFCEDGEELARGLTNFSSDEITMMNRFPATAISEILGGDVMPVLVAAKNMVRVEDHHLSWDAPQEMMEELAA